MTIPFYWKTTCHTCRVAKLDLEKTGVPILPIDIMATPPSKKILKMLVKRYGAKNMIRRNSKDYRALGVGKVKLNEEETVNLLHDHPDLANRPIVLVNGEAFLSKDPELQKLNLS
ncbi:MAG: hypothetical protein JRN20_07185 [Nitrososphaerota archaeon]|nr:hypothetical protein [Nitrososphaerota archaeon]